VADRTSAEIFGWLFYELAKRPAANVELAKKAWVQSQRYDFSECQMECDNELVVLGLAKKVQDKDDPECPETVYANSKGKLSR
jgi:hypothetical protein